MSAMCTHQTAPDVVLLTPRPYRARAHGGYDSPGPDTSWCHASGGYWYRMRNQRSYGWPSEAACYFVKRSMVDGEGRLWDTAFPAVVDDFGNLVAVQ